jgi:hypothetical protein
MNRLPRLSLEVEQQAGRRAMSPPPFSQQRILSDERHLRL